MFLIGKGNITSRAIYNNKKRKYPFKGLRFSRVQSICAKWYAQYTGVIIVSVNNMQNSEDTKICRRLVLLFVTFYIFCPIRMAWFVSSFRTQVHFLCLRANP